MKVSNSTIKLIFSIIYLSLNIILFITQQWLQFFTSTSCHKFLFTPFFFILIPFSFLLVGTLGLYNLPRRNNSLYVLYLCLLFSVVLVLFGLALFTLFVSTDKSGEYSTWVDKRAADSKTWKRVKACLVAENDCQNVGPDTKLLSPIQSGCCKPPESCGFMYVAPSTWNKTGTSTNTDCNAWDNNPNTLCYDCTSCKAGFVLNVKGDWKKVSLVNVVYFFFLVILFPIGIAAFCYNMRGDANCQVNPMKTVI